MLTAAAFAEATVEMDGSQLAGKVTQSPRTTRSISTQRLSDKRMAWFAALQVQDLAKTILRGEDPVEEWTDAQGNAAFPTPQEFL